MGEPSPPADPMIAALHPEPSPLLPRVALHFDNHPTVHVLQRDAARLAVGQRLSPEVLRDLQRRYQLRGAYLQAIRFLGARDRSAQEIGQHLRGRGWDPAACAEALAKLRAEGYVDDARFAEQWVARRCRTSPRSRMAVSQELRGKGIDRRTIQAALAVMDEDALALACARRKRRQWQRRPPEERFRRIVVFLQRKGFPYASCRLAAQRLCRQAPDD